MDTRGPLCAGIDPHAGLLSDWDLPDTVEGLRRFALGAAEALGRSRPRSSRSRPSSSGSGGGGRCPGGDHRICREPVRCVLDVSARHRFDSAGLRRRLLDTPRRSRGRDHASRTWASELDPMIRNRTEERRGVFVLAYLRTRRPAVPAPTPPTDLSSATVLDSLRARRTREKPDGSSRGGRCDHRGSTLALTSIWTSGARCCAGIGRRRNRGRRTPHLDGVLDWCCRRARGRSSRRPTRRAAAPRSNRLQRLCRPGSMTV